jgi:hypothetical protein
MKLFSVFLLTQALETLSLSKVPPAPVLAPANATVNASAPKLRGVSSPAHSFSATSSEKKGMPCQCVSSDPSWKAPTRTAPKCIFIDLGAADGNTFNSFINNGYGPVAQCPGGGQWEAYLVEANPRFSQPLGQLQTRYPGQVHSLSSTAAYMCEAQTSFFLDTTNVGHNYWGSSMSSDHPDVVKSGKEKVTVPTENIVRMLYENTIPGDWVMLKMDIEGSEWDVMPCIAEAPAASLIDRFYIEQHDPSWGMAGTTPAAMNAALATLRQRGVDIPKYFSQTL